MIDVKSIHEIPNIEDYLDSSFHLTFHEVEDSTVGYELTIQGNTTIDVEIISDEKTLFGIQTLYQLLDFENIVYFSFSLAINDYEIISNYVYRPLVDECNKNYK